MNFMDATTREVWRCSYPALPLTEGEQLVIDGAVIQQAIDNQFARVVAKGEMVLFMHTLLIHLIPYGAGKHTVGIVMHPHFVFPPDSVRYRLVQIRSHLVRQYAYAVRKLVL